jgi:Cu-Zn family superoxide dismutase
MRSVLFGTGFALVISAAVAAQTGQKATASFINAEGNPIGSATLTETANGVLIALDLQALPTGEHAFHIHQKGVCNIADKFMSAGPHFNVNDKKHGHLAEGGPHAGDMPNVVVAVNGTLRANILNQNVTLDSGPGSLFGPDGTSLVIHDRPDDYVSQPAGNAGDRIACAVIKR